LGIRRRTWVYFEAVPFSALGIRSLYDRIADARARDRALGVIYDDTSWNRAKPLEGSPVAAEPRHHCLVEDKLDVLMPRVTQRHHESPCATKLTARRIHQLRRTTVFDGFFFTINDGRTA
jgi:hypothetical protein